MLQDTTGERYARTLTRFAAAAIRSLHRSEGRFRLPLPETTRQKALDLFNALRSLPPPKKRFRHEVPAKPTPEEEAAMLKLQHFFYSSVVDSLSESQQDRFKCPVLTYTACFAYNEDDTWKVAYQATSMLAQWSFLLRGNALYHVMLNKGEVEFPLE